MMKSVMEQEALQAPHVLATQFKKNQTLLEELSKRLQQAKPRVAVTIARGSSDHAATFAKYLLETRAGIITSSAAPSVFTLYRKQLLVKDCLVIGISQSGASPDVAEMLASARQNGAVTVAIVNQTQSPLAEAAEYVVPLWAGEEKAVAATKTYLATLGALIQLTVALTQDSELLAALSRFPNELELATKMDWSAAIAELQHRHNTFVIGRGYGFPIAQEAALKLKETAKIHAEAFSGAEVLHGPFALIEKNFPILMLAQQDETLSGMLEIASRMKNLGVDVMLALPQKINTINLSDYSSIALPLPPALHPILDPLFVIQAFYMMVAQLSVARGFNPDAPDNLLKITKTW